MAHLRPGSPGTRPSAQTGPGEKQPSCSRGRQQEGHAGKENHGQYFPLPTAYCILRSNTAAAPHPRIMEPRDGVIQLLFSSPRTRLRMTTGGGGGKSGTGEGILPAPELDGSWNSPAALTTAFLRACGAAPASLANFSGRDFQESAAPSSSPTDVSLGQPACAEAPLS